MEKWGLTKRELEVLQHVGSGMTNKQVAAALGMSEQTVKNHTVSILKKLNVDTRTGAVVRALGLGLLSLNELVVKMLGEHNGD